MNEQFRERLKSLNAEYEAGQKMLAELDARRTALTSTLLRIEGAIQVLKELTEVEQPAGANGSERSVHG
ncbi:MAG TPA: hypothetical protein VGD80_44750 [Kofleriaceae bacterium]